MNRVDESVALGKAANENVRLAQRALEALPVRPPGYSDAVAQMKQARTQIETIIGVRGIGARIRATRATNAIDNIKHVCAWLDNIQTAGILNAFIASPIRSPLTRATDKLRTINDGDGG